MKGGINNQPINGELMCMLFCVHWSRI